MPISEKIKELRAKHDLTQSELGNIAGVSDKAVSTWENGTAEPRMGAIQRMAEHFHINKGWFVDDSYSFVRSVPDLSKISNLITPAAYSIPILGNICAGTGIWCEENYDGYFYVDKTIKADICLRVKGDSMTDANIDDGDIVFIIKNFDFKDGNIYAVVINDMNEAMLKSVHLQGDKLVLSPRNAEYPPIIEHAGNVTFVGECVGVYKNMKK